MQEETLIERFKAFYFDYRRTSDTNESFEQARNAVAYHVINEADRLAQDGDFDGVRSVCRQFREIQSSTYGSNDSVKERFEREYAGHRLH
ncbi:hypothetical protein [Gorillibacterium sp. sgz5001074]|uniref:hypothetical protein n=1 Tax=Gorillibacterium sp. sgz5001074 TaxID=3446695 RepID=UPI003F666860